jgi:hypothetical protein
MGARAGYSLDGEELAPTVSLSPIGHLTFKAASRFFDRRSGPRVMACRDRRSAFAGAGMWSAPVGGTSCCCSDFPGDAGPAPPRPGVPQGRPRHRRIGIGFAGAEQVVAAGGTEVAGGFDHDRANFGGLQGRTTLQQQGHQPADEDRGKRGERWRAAWTAYGEATATLTIFSPCSLRIRLAISSFDIGLLPNCRRNMPLRVSMIAA